MNVKGNIFLTGAPSSGKTNAVSNEYEGKYFLNRCPSSGKTTVIIKKV